MRQAPGAILSCEAERCAWVCSKLLMPWSRRFENPIPLPDGRTLRTLRDAASYLMALPGKTRQSDEWQAAIEALLMAAESTHPASTPGRRDGLPRSAQAATAALDCWFAFQFHGSRSATLLAGLSGSLASTSA